MDSVLASTRVVRRLRRLAVLALLALAVLTLALHGLTRRAVGAGADDARIVNGAGRQRMLSQRLTHRLLVATWPRPVASAGAAPSAAALREAARAEAAAVLGQWRDGHARLRREAARGLPGRDDPAVAAQFARVEAAFGRLDRAAARVLADTVLGQAQADLDSVLAAQDAFLAEMEAQVGAYERVARERVDGLNRLGLAFLALTLLVLLLEALFVFEPAIARIRALVERLSDAFEALTASKREAEAASAAKTAFLASLSHELRTPLNGIAGMAMLLDTPDLTDEQRELVTVLRASSDDLTGLVTRLLDVASQGGDTGSPTIGPVSLRRLLERATQDVVHAAADRGVTMRVAIAPALPTYVLTDSERLRAALGHLLSNAVKFTPSGEIRVEADRASAPVAQLDRSAAEPEATTGRPGAGERLWLRLSVLDTGIGMRPDQLAAAFEPFGQADLSSTRRTGGLGIGLPLARGLVESLGGDLQGTSAPGEGTAFHIVVPVLAPPGSEPAAARSGGV